MTDFGLPLHHYGALLIDPPWAFRTYSGDDVTPHRTKEDHYRVMSPDDLTRLPVRLLVAPDCALFLWVVDSHLDAGIELGKSWGFNYKTRAFEWYKTRLNGEPGYPISMGYWTRKQTESCLLFTRGSPRRLSKGVRQIIEEPRREHSRKPDEVYRRIEALVAGPYCELFATQRWPGWSGWGHEYPAPAEDAVRELTAALRAML